jgi:tyrosine-protein phosphatase YwqE
MEGKGSNMAMAERKETVINTLPHILTGADDGPKTAQESLTLEQALVQEGIHLVVATPHYNDMFPRYEILDLKFFGKVELW